MRPTVYLAGPIEGLTENQAKNWRDDTIVSLDQHNIQGISPLRCEPAINGRYDVPDNGQELDRRFGTPQAIFAKNRHDTTNCDMMLAYMPKKSVGTLIEMGWAFEAGKQIILCTRDDDMINHPVVMGCAGWHVLWLSDAVDIIIGMLGDYA